jgi:hypothetical protein
LANGLHAAEPPVATLAAGDALLAASTDEGRSWRVIRAGDSMPPARAGSALPPACWLRTPGVSIQIAADAHLRLDLAERSLTVASGSVFLKPFANPARQD